MRKYLLFLPAMALSVFSCRNSQDNRPAYREDPDLKKAQALYYANNDSAFYYFNKVVSGSRDSLQIGMAYNNMSMIQAGAGDYFGAQESLLASLKHLNKSKPDHINCLTSDYNELGLNSMDLKNYGAALTFYDSALSVVRDKGFAQVIANNQALAYQKKGAYAPALAIYRKALRATVVGTKEYARILSNMAKTHWLLNPGYVAGPELLKALNIRKAAEDLWGQNASFSHLADYYAVRRPDSALYYAGEMYRIASRLNSPDDRLEALQKLIRLGPVEQSKTLFLTYQQLDDSLKTARATAKNQFALIRYDVERNKADKLQLQKENTDKKYQITKQYILLVLILFTLLGAVLWYRNAMRTSKLKTSKKVHDVVANGLYRIMSRLENREQVDKEELLDEIEILYEQSRDISYDQPSQQVDPDYPQKIEELLQSFRTADREVFTVTNDATFWEEVNPRARYELEQVLQELLVNMKKHSGARTVVFKFDGHGNDCRIDYQDDGSGFPEEHIRGNGLKNTGNRIKKLRGQIIFDSKAGQGLHILITFPSTK